MYVAVLCENNYFDERLAKIGAVVIMKWVHVKCWGFSLYDSNIVPICDWACENQPCERKLHRVIFSLISFLPNALSHFRKLQKEAH